MDKVSFHLNILHASSASFTSRQVLSDSHFSSPCIIFNCVYLHNQRILLEPNYWSQRFPRKTLPYFQNTGMNKFNSASINPLKNFSSIEVYKVLNSEVMLEKSEVTFLWCNLLTCTWARKIKSTQNQTEKSFHSIPL